MMKKALVVGIDTYPESALNTCINDACKIEGLLGARCWNWRRGLVPTSQSRTLLALPSIFE